MINSGDIFLTKLEIYYRANNLGDFTNIFHSSAAKAEVISNSWLVIAAWRV